MNKYQKCPYCGCETAYYIGIAPHAVKCSNLTCKWFESRITRYEHVVGSRVCCKYTHITGHIFNMYRDKNNRLRIDVKPENAGIKDLIGEYAKDWNVI